MIFTVKLVYNVRNNITIQIKIFYTDVNFLIHYALNKELHKQISSNLKYKSPQKTCKLCLIGFSGKKKHKLLHLFLVVLNRRNI